MGVSQVGVSPGYPKWLVERRQCCRMRKFGASSPAKQKAYKVYDDRGLYMVVNPNGSRWWRFKYKYGGKERGISLGVYPDVT